MRILFFLRVELPHPLLRGLDYFFSVPFAQFNPGTMTNSIHWMSKIFQQILDCLAFYFDGFLQRLLFECDAKNSTMFVVAVRVTHIVLHMPDDYILPVRAVKSSIFSEYRIRWTKILISTEEESFRFLLYFGTIRQGLGYFQFFSVGGSPNLSKLSCFSYFLSLLAPSDCSGNFIPTITVKLILFNAQKTD